jgi:hypothetical protein
MTDLAGEKSTFSGYRQPTLAMRRFTVSVPGIPLESSAFLLVQMSEGVA